MTAAVTVIRLPYDGSQQTVTRVLTTIGRSDLDLAQRLHDPTTTASVTYRPYSVARYPDALHVCCFEDAVAKALLGGEPSAVLVTRALADDLAAPGCEGPTIRLAFTAPTSFRVAGLDHLLPDPVHVFGGLLARWRQLGWPGLAEPVWKRVPCWPELLTFRTMTKAGRARRGLVGSVRFAGTPQEAEARATLWTLARFAEYAGVGQGTTYGMGRIRLLRDGERWAPGDRRISAWDRPS